MRWRVNLLALASLAPLVACTQLESSAKPIGTYNDITDPAPAPILTEPPGPPNSPSWQQTTNNENGTFTFEQMINAASTAPHYTRPAHGGGFSVYSWFNQDYGWQHDLPQWSSPGIQLHSVTLTLRAWDVDSEPSHGANGEYDGLSADGQWLDPQYLQGTNNNWSVTVFNVEPADLAVDGVLDLWLNIDMNHNYSTWATTLDYSWLTVVYSFDNNQAPYAPELSGEPEGVACDDDALLIAVLGPTPADPDGDTVTYEYRWFVDVGNGFYLDDEFAGRGDHTGPVVPGADTVFGDLWKVAVTPIDEHGRRGPASEIYFTIGECNAPPIADAGEDVLAECGSAVTLDGTGSFDPEGGALLYSWSPASLFLNPSSATPTGLFPLGVTSVTLTVTDARGAVASDVVEVTLRDTTPPSLTLFGAPSQTLECTEAYTELGAEATDLCDAAPTLSLSGSVDSTTPGSYALTYTATDASGNSTSLERVVSVVDTTAPLVGEISAPAAPVQIETLFTVSAPFKEVCDPNAIAYCEFGDGSQVEASLQGGSLFASYAYTTPGVYTVRCVVEDSAGNFGEAEYQFVVAYDPYGGFVTGGGELTSPVGAYLPDETLFGKTTFGFVSKYHKGALVPVGQTEFQFHVAGMNFHSSSYEWLVIAGAKAIYKGRGAINGEEGYGFLLSAIDGQLSGGGGVDKLRMKIWRLDTGDIVYDNQRGDSDDAAARTAINKGSIVIHKK